MKVLLLLASAAAAMWPFSGRLPGRPDPLAEVEKLNQQGKFDLALDHMDETIYRRGLSNADKRRAFLLFGRSLEGLGRFDRALTHYEVALQLFPKDKELTLALAELYHREQIDDKARPLFERVLKQDRRNARAHVGLAESYESLGLYDEAIAHYREAIGDWWAGEPSIWANYARALGGERDFAGAEAAIQKAISLGPSPERLEDLAVYQRGQGKLDASFDSLSGAIAGRPKDATLRLRRALWLLGAGRSEEAARDIDKAFELEPANALAQWAKGLLYLRSGRKVEARLAFQLAAASGKGFVAQSAREAAKAIK